MNTTNSPNVEILITYFGSLGEFFSFSKVEVFSENYSRNSFLSIKLDTLHFNTRCNEKARNDSCMESFGARDGFVLQQ